MVLEEIWEQLPAWGLRFRHQNRRERDKPLTNKDNSRSGEKGYTSFRHGECCPSPTLRSPEGSRRGREVHWV